MATRARLIAIPAILILLSLSFLAAMPLMTVAAPLRAATPSTPAVVSATSTATSTLSAAPSLTVTVTAATPEPGSAVPVTSPIAVATPSGSSSATFQVNINQIFPPGEGRQQVFDNCFSSCHSFRPLLQQKTEGAWTTTCINHMVRHVVGVSAADWAALCGYLQANFNPGKPLPKLPPNFPPVWVGY